MVAKSSLYHEVKSWKKPVHLTREFLARTYIKLLKNTEVIAITGSVGKTLTQKALFCVLSQKFNTKIGEDNLDPTFRIPKTILSTKPWHQKLILEFGIEHPGDMDHYLTIAKPKIGILTVIAPTHTKYFKDEVGVFNEKVKLIKSLPETGVAFLNKNDPFTKKIKKIHAKKIYFGKETKNGVKIENFRQGLFGAEFFLKYKRKKSKVIWSVLGKHHLNSAYIAATLGIYYAISLDKIAKGLSKVVPPEHRLNLIKENNFTILDDTYNSSPLAAKEAITTLNEIGKNMYKIAVIGQMKDLGSISKFSHIELGKFIATKKINKLITIGTSAKEVAKSASHYGFQGKTISFKYHQETILEIMKEKKVKPLILIKGSRHEHLERIVNLLLGKNQHINCYHCGLLK